MITAKEMEAKRKKVITGQMKSNLEDLFWELNEYDFTELVLVSGAEYSAYPALSNLDGVHLFMVSDYLKEKGYNSTRVYSDCEIYYLQIDLPNPSGLPTKVYGADIKPSDSGDTQAKYGMVEIVESPSLWSRFKRWIRGEQDER